MTRLNWKAPGLAALLSLTFMVAAPAAYSQTPDSSPPSIAAPVPPPSPDASPAELEARGDQLRAQKLYRDAEDYYLAAMKRSQERRANLYNKIGLAQLQAGRYSDAKKSFERAIKADKTLPEYHNNLGVIHYIQKKYGRAVKEYKKALALKEDSASVHNNLATVYFAQKKFDQAAAEYQRALQLDPGIFDRNSRNGINAQMSSPEDRAAYSYVLARLYAKKGDFDHSLEYLRKAMEDGYKEIGKVYQEDEFKELRKDPRFAALMSSKPVAITN